MSSILKALKKLEEEKVARLSGQVEISRAILTEKTSLTRRRSSILLIGSVLFLTLVVLVGGVALWLSRGVPPSGPLRSNAPQMPQSPPAVASPPTRPATIPSTTVPAAPAPLAARKPAAAVASIPQPPTSRQKLPRQASPAPQPEATVTPLAKPVTAPIATPQTPVETMARPAPVLAPPQPHAVPALRVSGIAWQKDSASRLAIVNGQPVGLGAAVDGATVEEIFPDRVRFSVKGEKIEVGLGRSSKGE